MYILIDLFDVINEKNNFHELCKVNCFEEIITAEILYITKSPFYEVRTQNTYLKIVHIDSLIRLEELNLLRGKIISKLLSSLKVEDQKKLYNFSFVEWINTTTIKVKYEENKDIKIDTYDVYRLRRA